MQYNSDNVTLAQCRAILHSPDAMLFSKTDREAVAADLNSTGTQAPAQSADITRNRYGTSPSYRYTQKKIAHNVRSYGWSNGAFHSVDGTGDRVSLTLESTDKEGDESFTVSFNFETLRALVNKAGEHGFSL